MGNHSCQRTIDSCVLRTPPPRPIQWAVDSPKIHAVNLIVDGPSSSPPEVTHQAVDNDDSAKRRLDSFINNITRKRDSPLIREPPKQPPTKPVLPWRSRRLAAQSLSWVPASKRGEMLIMQRMGYIRDPSAPSASEFEAFDGLLTTTWLRPKPRRWTSSSRPLERQRPSNREDARPQSYVDIGCFLLCNIETWGLLLGWSSFGYVKSDLLRRSIEARCMIL